MYTNRLVLRLSSLGDVILATSVLETLSNNQQLDWLTGAEYAELIEGHPKVKKTWKFNRKAGLSGWIQLSRQIWENHYDEIYDLHRTLRTRLMKIFFVYWSFVEKKSLPKWKTISKQRLRLYLFYLLKRFSPRVLKPTPWVERFTCLLGGSGKERPNLTHLLDQQDLPADLQLFLNQYRMPYLCVMPSSRWDGKKWPVLHYFKTLEKLPHRIPVILGSTSDRESIELVEMLAKAGKLFYSGVGKWKLKQTAAILSESDGYLGGDTGLAHLAEAVGTSARVIFGPTSPDMGFGPWRKESRSLGLSLGCRPCSKDGRFCYRITKKYYCLKGLSPETVLESFKKN
jgi:heptosyltransferase-2